MIPMPCDVVPLDLLLVDEGLLVAEGDDGVSDEDEVRDSRCRFWLVGPS